MSDKLEKVMKLDHIRSQVSFREWLKKNLAKESGALVYKKDEIIPKDHLFIFLNYIDRQINDQMPEDHREWMARVKNIRDRLKENE